jgi:hypothetical protein
MLINKPISFIKNQIRINKAIYRHSNPLIINRLPPQQSANQITTISRLPPPPTAAIKRLKQSSI